MRVVEVTILCLITTSMAYWLPYVNGARCFYNGFTNGGEDEADIEWRFLVRYNCPSGYFNPAATLFFNSEGTIIKSIVTGFTFQNAHDNLLSSQALGTFGLF